MHNLHFFPTSVTFSSPKTRRKYFQMSQHIGITLNVYYFYRSICFHDFCLFFNYCFRYKVDFVSSTFLSSAFLVSGKVQHFKNLIMQFFAFCVLLCNSNKSEIFQFHDSSEKKWYLTMQTVQFKVEPKIIMKPNFTTLFSLLSSYVYYS